MIRAHLLLEFHRDIAHHTPHEGRFLHEAPHFKRLDGIGVKRIGVAVKQPTTLAERNGVAQQFCERLKPTMPFVVDDVNDAVGNAYSGMPGRMYIIDCQGKVAYKSGRGPFGFKIGEMEQALVMALLERSVDKSK